MTSTAEINEQSEKERLTNDAVRAKSLLPSFQIDLRELENRKLLHNGITVFASRTLFENIKDMEVIIKALKLVAMEKNND